MARPLKKQKPISPPARVVLDYLARQPARVHDFSEIAGPCKLKRPVVQRAITELRHPNAGSLLKAIGPDGLRLRARHAYLPADAPIRGKYPQPEHPKVEAKEHPSVTALRDAKDQQAAQAAAADVEIRAKGEERARKKRLDKIERKIAVARQRNAEGEERDELRAGVPTIEEVLEAGYDAPTAKSIVAELQARADGKPAAEAELIGAQVYEAEAAAPKAEEQPWTADAEIEDAFADDDGAPFDEALDGEPGEADASPAATDEDNFEPDSEDADDAETLKAAIDGTTGEPPPKPAKGNKRGQGGKKK